MATTLYLITHALTDWNEQARIQGHIDTPLNEQGLGMANCLAKYLKNKPISIIYTSDLKRAIQTAMPLAQKMNIPIRTDERLREGRSYWQDISEVYPLLPYDLAWETETDVLNRITSVMNEIPAAIPSKSGLVISHGKAVELFIQDILNRNKVQSLKYTGIRMALNTLSYNEGYWRCVELNKIICSLSE